MPRKHARADARAAQNDPHQPELIDHAVTSRLATYSSALADAHRNMTPILAGTYQGPLVHLINDIKHLKPYLRVHRLSPAQARILQSLESNPLQFSTPRTPSHKPVHITNPLQKDMFE